MGIDDIAVKRLNNDIGLSRDYEHHWIGCGRAAKNCWTCLVYINSDHYKTTYRKQDSNVPLSDDKTNGYSPRIATSQCPYEDDKVTIITIDPMRVIRYFKSKGGKRKALLDFRPSDETQLLVAWPGNQTQDIFQIHTTEEREKALIRLGLRPRSFPVQYHTAADGTVWETTE